MSNNVYMNTDEVIRNFIVDNFLFGDDTEFTNDTDLFEKSIVDSIGILELISFIEIYFKITIRDGELIQKNFSSVRTISAFLQSKFIIAA